MNQYKEAFKHIRTFPPAFWSVIVATFMNQVGNMAFVFLMLYSTQQLGFSLAKASFVFAAVCGSMFLNGLFAGNWIDQWGAIRIMVIALIANGITLLLFAFIHDFYLVIMMCVLWGCFYGLYQPAAQTMVSKLSTPGLHKITFSVYRLALNLGMSLGPAIGGYLAGYYFPLIFIANGIANLLAGILLIFGVFLIKWPSHSNSTSQKKVFILKWLKQDAVLRLFIFAMLPVLMIFFQHESTLAVFLSDDLHLSLTFYGILFTINTVLIVLFELPLNVATMHWTYRTNFIMGTLFITAGFGGLYFATTAWHIILLTVFWTVGEMILFPSASGYMTDIAPATRRGSYMSIFSASSNLGMLLGPWGGALIMQQIGAKGLWIICGVFGMISVAIFWSAKESLKTEKVFDVS